MYEFNQLEWMEKIKKYDWYTHIPEALLRLNALREIDWKLYKIQKELIYDFFEEQYKLGNIALGISGKDFDKSRKNIDTIVIHHTSRESGLSNERLSAIELVRLYGPQYAGKGPTYSANKEIKDKPVYSGHFRNGVQVFWPYHWMVRVDGTCERLLNDNEVGWQAGDWDVNCRSVAICIDDDLIDSSPSDKIISAIAELIKNNYPQVPIENIKGHREINLKTTCPGNHFLNGWKNELIKLLTVSK